MRLSLADATSLVGAVMLVSLLLRLTSSGNNATYDDVTRAVFLISLAVLLVLGVLALARQLRRSK
jgi:ABC-type nickel/cobalt efflux system permease component RcnA